jgi:hypothetical protein
MAAVRAEPEVDEETIAATAAVLSTLIGAAAAAAEQEEGGGGGFDLRGALAGAGRALAGTGSAVGSALLSAGSALRGAAGRLAEIAGGPGPVWPGDLGLQTSGLSTLGMYAYPGRDLREYVGSVTRTLRMAGALDPTGEPVPAEITWANAVLKDARGSSRKTLETHAKQLARWSADISNGIAIYGQEEDRVITVIDASGKPERVKIRNPYREDVITSRAGDSITNETNLDAIAALGVGNVPGFDSVSDSRRQLQVLEALWLCGSNAALQDSPACFPLRLLGEFAETKKYGSVEKARAEAAQVLEVITPHFLKEVVRRITGQSAAGGGESSASGGSGAATTASGASSASGGSGAATTASGASSASGSPGAAAGTPTKPRSIRRRKGDLPASIGAITTKARMPTPLGAPGL